MHPHDLPGLLCHPKLGVQQVASSCSNVFTTFMNWLASCMHGCFMAVTETVLSSCSYSVAAHEALQRAGFAPRLHGCERLPGRWLMVVMEYLEGACTWDAAMEKPTDALRAAVAALHAAGFVHGDLRGCNVLVDKQQVCADLWNVLQRLAA